MVKWCAVLLLLAAVAASASAAPGSPIDSGPAPRLVLPHADQDARLQDDEAGVVVGLPAGVARDITPPRYRFRPAPKAPVRAAGGEDPYRLPNTVVPTFYKLALSVDLEGFNFTGSVSIDLNVLADTNTIVLHAATNLTVNSEDISVIDKTTQKEAAKVTEAAKSPTYQTLTITLDSTLTKNMHYTLHIKSFSSELSADLDGFYLSSYKTGDETRYLATTQFESTAARKAFPCFDEPSLKARFSISISHDASLGVRCNMPQTQAVTTGEGNWKTTTFETTVPMSTYLLAWVVSDFEERTNDDKTFSTWARSDIVNGSGMSQEVGPKALTELAQYTGIKYELPKMDQFAIPDFSAGAMENWGLVTYREPYLIQTESTDVRYEQEIATVICHELGHQWTGDLVTLDWWSNTWLNEGFATFFENFICDKIKPDMRLVDKAVTTYAQVAFEKDLDEKQHAMSSDVSTPEEIESKFDRISYSKGGTVLRMFQHILTPDVFQKGLARYLASNKYQNGTPDKLFRAFSAEAAIAGDATVSLPAGVNFTTVAKSWTEQAGAPLVRADCNFANKKCVLYQKQLRPASSAATADKKWYIPVTVLTSKQTEVSTKTVQWLTPEVDTITIDVSDAADFWIVFNPQQTGYYRVSYCPGSRKRLLAALKDPKNDVLLDAATRSGVLGDMMSMAMLGREDYGNAMPFLDIIKGSMDSAVWGAGFRVISQLVNELANTEVYPTFQILLNKLSADTFQEVGVKVQDDDDHNKRHVRYYVAPYACASGNAACLKEARDLLDGLLTNGTSLHVDTMNMVLCYGVKADEAMFARVKAMWQKQEPGTTRDVVNAALGCSSNWDLVKGVLTELLASEEASAKHDLEAALTSLITSQPEHRSNFFQFLKDELQNMDNFFIVAKPVNSLISLLIDTIRSDTELIQVRQWVKATLSKRDQYNDLEKKLMAADERLNAFYRKNYQTVANYIYTATGVNPPTTDGPNTTTGPGSTTAQPSTPKPSGGAFVRASAATLLAPVLLVAALAQRS